MFFRTLKCLNIVNFIEFFFAKTFFLKISFFLSFLKSFNFLNNSSFTLFSKSKPALPLDKNSFGPDSTSSIEVRDVQKMSKNLNELHDSLNNYKYNDKYSKKNKIIFGKTLSVNKDLCKGKFIDLNDLESKKPANMGVSSYEYKSVIGKKLIKNIKSGEFLTKSHLK